MTYTAHIVREVIAVLGTDLSHPDVCDIIGFEDLLDACIDDMIELACQTPWSAVDRWEAFNSSCADLNSELCKVGAPAAVMPDRQLFCENVQRAADNKHALDTLGIETVPAPLVAKMPAGAARIVNQSAALASHLSGFEPLVFEMMTIRLTRANNWKLHPAALRDWRNGFAALVADSYLASSTPSAWSVCA